MSNSDSILQDWDPVCPTCQMPLAGIERVVADRATLRHELSEAQESYCKAAQERNAAERERDALRVQIAALVARAQAREAVVAAARKIVGNAHPGGIWSIGEVSAALRALDAAETNNKEDR